MKKITLKEYFEIFRVKIGLKITLVGVICILINNIFHFDLDYLSTLFAFLILALAHGETLKVGSQAFLGVIISGTVTLIITYFFVEFKVLYLILMGLWIFFCITFVNKFFLPTLLSAIAATMTMYTAVYISVSDATSTIESYTLQLAIAVIICWVIDGLVWPHRSRANFQLTLRTIYEEFSELFSGFVRQRVVDRKSHLSISISLITFSNLVTYLYWMRREERNREFPIDQYMKIIAFSRGIFIKIEVLEEFILKEHSFMKDEQVTKNVNQILSIISQSFSILAQSIGTKNIVNIEDKELEDSIASLHELYRDMHEVEGMQDEYYEDLHAFGAMLPVLDDISKKIKKIADAINIFHKDEYQTFLENRVTRTNKVEKMKARSLISINKENSIPAIKTVIIFVLLLFGEFVLGLPGGGQVAFYAILFGIVPNLGQAYMKSAYGILGVLLGLVFAVLSLILISQTPHFMIFLSLYCLGTFIAAYFASSSKDISVAGLQAGLIIPYGLLFSTGPQVDLSSAITRVLALLSAAFIAIIVHYLVWPMNPYKLLKQKISKSIYFSGQIISKLVMLVDIEDREKVDDLVLPIAAVLPTSTALLHDAEYIIRQDELHAEQFIQIIESIELIYADLETLKRTLEGIDNKLAHSYLDSIKTSYEKMCRIFEEVSLQFNNQEDYGDQIIALKEEIEKQTTQYRESGEWRTYDSKEVEKLVLINTSLESLLKSLNTISFTISEINQGKAALKSTLMVKES